MNNKLNIDKVFICHWSKLVDRKKSLIEHLNNKEIFDFEWIELYDKETWDVDEIKKEYPLIFDSVPHGALLNLSEISLALKHCYILKQIISNNYNSVLVLEDDVVLAKNFIDNFNSYKDQLPIDWDLGWVGTCCGLAAPYEPNKNVYRMDGSRCTHAFIVSNNGAKKISSILHTADDAADWLYNRFIKELNLNNYWFEPALAIQNKSFNTTIQNEKR